MGALILTPEKVTRLEKLLEDYLISAGVSLALLIDEAGNILVSQGSSREVDTTALAALAAANFGATNQIAKILGEEDFSILYHKGKKDNIHLSKIREDLILVTVFTDEVPLGLVRLKVSQLAKELEKV
ncbi:roadblock/LC7 domain-containing protein [Thermosulfurimonas marina]|uniref:Roadblock/LC7 domain-containing protein n=1 Tax=Thermosulfurimonas marina TaxID=2047767 RepID=A0A6H1WUD3_9BACT|nr:roadblock/LC7 domain-containing protein [Thermosulfurimonas marina]QJA06716.1 roadblock/LC7 domain-containing protein [Thermosulfurimonas marina]